jgi:hypothetical protein
MNDGSITRGVNRGKRLTVSMLVALATGGFTYLLEWRRDPRWLALDFTYPWMAARGLLAGENPYSYVLQHLHRPYAAPLFYPLPAALIAVPFARMPPHLAGAAFVGIGCGLLAYQITRRSYWHLAIFASGPAYQAYFSVQWSPLLSAAALCGPALGILAAKPNAAIPLLAFQSDRRSLAWGAAGAALLCIVAFVLVPSWPVDWWRTISSAPDMKQYRVPMLSLWGLVLWLPVLRWRRREARLLFVMACVPQNFFFYDQLPLLLVAQTPVEVVSLALLSLIGKLLMGDPLGGPSPAEWSEILFSIVVAFGYLPCILLVLRRPNRLSTL